VIALLAALVLGVPHNAPSPIGPDPHPDATQCVYVIPIATPGAWMCPDGFSPSNERN
jgi:hypothetical protein